METIEDHLKQFETILDNFRQFGTISMLWDHLEYIGPLGLFGTIWNKLGQFRKILENFGKNLEFFCPFLTILKKFVPYFN